MKPYAKESLITVLSATMSKATEKVLMTPDPRARK
jgi:hypothetical protein